MSAERFCKFTYLKGLHGHRFPKDDGAYRVLVTVLDYADKHGRNAHPGITRLADDCAMGASTIRRHLKWLTEHGYIVQESRGHNVGHVNLASVYSLAMPDLPLATERKVETPTAQLEPPTAHLEQTYRSVRTYLPLTGEHLSSPVSDPLSSDPSTSNPRGDDEWLESPACDDPGWGEPEPVRDEDPGWGWGIRPEPKPEPEFYTWAEHQRRSGSPSSMPTKIEPENWCRAEECEQAPIPDGRSCFQHLHLITASA